MRGLMMDSPLLVSSLIEHAAQVFGDTEIVSRTVEDRLHRYTWQDARHRSKRLAGALRARGVRQGDRVASIAWNGYRHLELYYGISGMGAVIHTVNPRLHESQLAYVLNHAEDRVVFVESTFVPLLEPIADRLKSVRSIVVMTDRDHVPESMLDLICYEDLLEEHDGVFEWPILEEKSAAGICYTSGTTGNPKGVVFSHRSTVLHAFAVNLPTAVGLNMDDVVLPVVPMFHVNAWGIPYCAAMTGVKLVLPGPRLDGESLTDLMNGEEVTLYAGVPTVHLGLLEYWDTTGASVPSMRVAVTGGSAPAYSTIQSFLSRGIEVVHGWGMTETSPIGTISRLSKSKMRLTVEEQIEILIKQGRPVFGVELRIVDEEGEVLPHDGKAAGELQVRGPWIVSKYLGEKTGNRADSAQWFSTGDVAVIHPDSTLHITDRKKDIIKSGGEWISSIDLEDAAMRHPDVVRAAVIGVPHEKWNERPLLIVVPSPGSQPPKQSILDFLELHVAKWWLPDDVVFVESLPLGATGKVQKAKLKERFSIGRDEHS